MVTAKIMLRMYITSKPIEEKYIVLKINPKKRQERREKGTQTTWTSWVNRELITEW